MQKNADSVGRMQHLLLHLVTTIIHLPEITIVSTVLRKRLRLTEQLSDILDALRFLLVFTHHA